MSVNIIYLSLVDVFATVFRPLVGHRHVSLQRVLFDLMTMLNVILVFRFSAHCQINVYVKIVSSTLTSLFAVIGGGMTIGCASDAVLLCRVLNNFLKLSYVLPTCLRCFPIPSVLPNTRSLVCLLYLTSIYAIKLCVLRVRMLGIVSTFAIGLDCGLRPVCDVVNTVLVFRRTGSLGFDFCLKLKLVILSIMLRALGILSRRRGFVPSLCMG